MPVNPIQDTNSLDRNLLRSTSVLRRNPFTETFEYPVDFEGIPANLVKPGFKTATDPNVSRGEISVRPGESIQQAVDLANDRGGGTVRLLAGTHSPPSDITMATRVSLIGEGRDRSIIDFGDAANGLLYVGTSGALLENFIIRDFTVQNSNHTSGIQIDFCDFWRMENIRVTSCDQDAVSLDTCNDFIIDNVLSDTNARAGFIIDDCQRFGVSNSRANANIIGGFVIFNSVGQCTDFTFINCLSDSNSDDGFDIDGSNVNNYSFIVCTAANNTTSGSAGFDFNQASSENASLISCHADNNTSAGFTISSDGVSMVGCRATDNGGDGINVRASVRVVGCLSTGNTGDEFSVSLSTTEAATLIGNEINFGDAVVPNITGLTDENVTVKNTTGGSPVTERRVLRALNSSGDALALGDAVVFAAAADGDEITTTTTQGDDKVFGMSLGTISNGNYGFFLTEGFTVALKVDGTTDIAIGDFLGTFTTAKIAMKAAAGDMAFAIALEAYTTDDSSGVIDALLVTPRKI